MDVNRVGTPHVAAGSRFVSDVVGPPSTRRAFLGSFAPLFYDFHNTHTVSGQVAPNAVLENAVGLMLCYDELWFLHRSQCPADMQNLDFVKFVSDDSELTARFREAQREGDDIFTRLLKRRLNRNPFPPPGMSFRFSWLRTHIEEGMTAGGHETDLKVHELPFREPLTLNMDRNRFFAIPWRVPIHMLAEWWAADALELGPMDCTINTGSSMRLRQIHQLPTPGGMQFEGHKVAAIEQILHLRSTDLLTPRGAYDDYIADLRKDKRVINLRTFLAGHPSPDGTATKLAQSVEALIADYQKEAFRRMHRPTVLRALGSIGFGLLGNAVQPGLGVLGQLFNVDRLIADFKFRQTSRWAMFVLDARDKRQPREPCPREK
ncbi:hypothetical protein [Streptomyces sp. NPDC046832]|uniref:hypothetical protein n=1 Tax=Streptomyces sp. NPDC046832 TaxID=3155020 RepID=UPI0033E5AB52